MTFVHRFARYGLACYNYDNDEKIVLEKRITNSCVLYETLEFNG